MVRLPHRKPIKRARIHILTYSMNDDGMQSKAATWCESKVLPLVRAGLTETKLYTFIHIFLVVCGLSFLIFAAEEF